MTTMSMWEQLSEHTRFAQPYIQKGIFYVSQARDMAVANLNQYCPQVQHFNRFQIFLTLNAVVIGLFVLFKILAYLNPFAIYRKVVKASFKLPIVQQKMKAEILKSKTDFLNSYPQKYRSQLKKIPYSPVEPNFGTDCEMESVKGNLSGSRYPDKKHSDFVINLAKQFSYSNPLHFDLHPHLKQMQVQVLKMCSKMLNFRSDRDQVVGGFFSGGTQSILMAILAYRQYGYKYRGVQNPNLVICSTGHAAALKAADLFGIQVRIVRSDKNEQMDVSDMKGKLDDNTICVYTSYPNYPYGTIDPIDEIAYICKKKGIPVHIDMCLGGYLVPFLKKDDGSPFFEVPAGVTSISLDCHKYGLSAKGASVLLFSSQNYRKQQLFVTSDWPGGFYGTIGIAGSRTGATIASAWISMMRMGQKGYTKNANSIRNAVKTLAKQLKSLGFKVFGNPEICCIGFNHPRFAVGDIKEALKIKGWDFPIIQKPMALHFSFTPINCVKIDQIVSDIKSILPQLQKTQKSKKNHKGSQLQLYGICSKIPDTSSKDLIMKSVIDCFLQI